MTAKLEKRLENIRRFGMYPEIAPAPRDAVTFDCMILAYLDEAKKRLYQVFFYHTGTDEIQKVA